VYLLHVAGREEAFGRRQPYDPVVDVGVEPVCTAAQLIDTRLADLETDARVIGKALFVFQVGVAARQEIEVVERREPVVA